MLAPAMMPEIDEMLITEPPSLWVCFLISATPCLQPRNTPSRSIAWTLRHSSSVMSSTVLLSPMPAELSSTWMAPNFSTVCAMADCQFSSDVTSSFTKWPEEPSFSATALPRSAAMSATTTLAPSCAISRAALAPRPEAPPVIRATLPARRSVISPLPPDLASRRSCPRQRCLARRPMRCRGGGGVAGRKCRAVAGPRDEESPKRPRSGRRLRRAVQGDAVTADRQDRHDDENDAQRRQSARDVVESRALQHHATGDADEV